MCVKYEVVGRITFAGKRSLLHSYCSGIQFAVDSNHAVLWPIAGECVQERLFRASFISSPLAGMATSGSAANPIDLTVDDVLHQKSRTTEVVRSPIKVVPGRGSSKLIFSVTWFSLIKRKGHACSICNIVVAPCSVRTLR